MKNIIRETGVHLLFDLNETCGDTSWESLAELLRISQDTYRSHTESPGGARNVLNLFSEKGLTQEIISKWVQESCIIYDGVLEFLARCRRVADMEGVSLKIWVVSLEMVPAIKALFGGRIDGCFGTVLMEQSGRLSLASQMTPELKGHAVDLIVSGKGSNYQNRPIGDIPLTEAVDLEAAPLVIAIGNSIGDASMFTETMRYGGHAICVYAENRPDQEVLNMLEDPGINLLMPRDFSEEGDLWNFVKAAIVGRLDGD